jgi:hypothetical protein
MSIQRSSRYFFAPALVGVLASLWLAACGGSTTPAALGACVDNLARDPVTGLCPCPIPPGSPPGTVNPPPDQYGVCDDANTKYYVVPAQNSLDQSLNAAVNDPGPDPTMMDDCTDPAGYEFFLVDDYEAGLATKSYTYNDTTNELLPLAIKDWQPSSTPIPWGPRCGSTHAMHFGGVHTNWGAGYGTAIYNHLDTLNPDLNNPTVVATDFSEYTPAKPWGFFWPGDQSLTMGLQAVDLTGFEGVSFWARRSPYSNDGFRVGVLDRTTSDDFNKQLPPDKASCKTIYTLCSCQNNKPCLPWDPATATNVPVNMGIEAIVPDVAGTYCWDPSVDPYPGADPTLRCGQTACNWRVDTPLPTLIDNPQTADAALKWLQPGPPDPKTGMSAPGIGTMTCSPEPYVFQNSTTPSGQYCYDPSRDAPPAEVFDRCGDAFLGPTPIDTNWHRYMVRFVDMRQGNFDKRSNGMDLSVAESLVFAFPGGNLDVWIDDLKIYRKTPQ